MRMGKTRIIAETGAGQHGVATATVCARFGLPCVVYMGAVDVERQKPNVFRMNLLGAEVRPVTSGSATLKDAMNEALRDWVTTSHRHFTDGSAAGPHPYTRWRAIPGRHRRRDPRSCWRGGGLPTWWWPAAGRPNRIGCPSVHERRGLRSWRRGVRRRHGHRACGGINGGRRACCTAQDLLIQERKGNPGGACIRRRLEYPASGRARCCTTWAGPGN